MNNLIKNIKNLPRTARAVLGKTYGLSSSSLYIYCLKNNKAKQTLSSNANLLIERSIERSTKLNRFLRIEKKTSIEDIRRQSSWKGLRFRQGLPVNGQRTHTNSAVAKKLNLNMSNYTI